MKSDYQLIDCGNFEKLEKVGPYIIRRPAPGATWRPRLPHKQWIQDADATFTRNSSGNGKWSFKNRLPEEWAIQCGNIHLLIRPTGFGHLGLFAEQEMNWVKIQNEILTRKSSLNEPFRFLNLFAYTGGASLAAALAGAEVVHLDASKTSNQWARDNAKISGLDNAPIRWITEDVVKFVEKELRRGRTYHGINLDPPSFGRGEKNQLWKIEDHLTDLLDQLKQLMSPNGCFVILSSHSPGYTPISLKNLLMDVGNADSQYECEEMIITDESQRNLPSGAVCWLK